MWAHFAHPETHWNASPVHKLQKQYIPHSSLCTPVLAYWKILATSKYLPPPKYKMNKLKYGKKALNSNFEKFKSLSYISAWY